MRVSLNWLKEFLDIETGVDGLAEKMTMLGLEIESVERPGAEINKVVVGQIVSIEPHPKADKLVVCKTDVGQPQPVQIVCGAKNVRVGDRIPTALDGATLPGAVGIGCRKMRGVESCGMMCSAHELGLGEDHSGLMILEPNAPIGQDIVSHLGLDDAILEVEVTPNRGDWACMIGVARELAALFETPIRVPEVHIAEGAQRAARLSSVTIEAPELCPRYIGRLLSGVQVGPSPSWLCQRLLAAGQRPINNIVDVTNFVLLETGHPLHAFDYDKLSENRIVVRCAKQNETLETLDGQVRKLDSSMLVIADAERPVALAGIMGGHDSEVGESTSRVFLESAYFEPVSIRRTARALGMQTEASVRFQRGADPEMALFAINRAAGLVQELAGAEVAAGLLDEYPNPPAPVEVELRYGRSDDVLGTCVAPREQRGILERLGFVTVRSSDAGCVVRVPSWRHDVSREADLIEEVARLHGYDKIGVTLPTVRQIDEILAPEEAKLRALRRFLVGQGLTEVFNWTFDSAEAVRKCGLPEAYLDMVELQNPISEQNAAMRSTLIPGLLATASRNLRHGNLDLAAFEIGPVYGPAKNDQELPDQYTRLAIALSGRKGTHHWGRAPEPYDFYDLKGYAESALGFFGVYVQFDAADFGPFQSGHCGRASWAGQPLGYLGMVGKEVLRAFETEQAIFLLEFDLDPLLAHRPPPPEFQTVPAYPASLRDMAVVVDASVPAGELEATARQVGGALLKRVEIFDVYSGKQIPEGKKSVAMNLFFQADDRTLKDEETLASWDTILKHLQERYGAQLR
ncbi:MAG TPA: phenylalanine--tRNA ligase subunit beta [Candidatus Hydrogenedentes bacterium]|nr:phenylalanine--tRNA ligase subunit beta [Candidatus Hydrogenedentota bacterium]